MRRGLLRPPVRSLGPNPFGSARRVTALATRSCPPSLLQLWAGACQGLAHCPLKVLCRLGEPRLLNHPWMPFRESWALRRYHCPETRPPEVLARTVGPAGHSLCDPYLAAFSRSWGVCTLAPASQRGPFPVTGILKAMGPGSLLSRVCLDAAGGGAVAQKLQQ